MTTVWARTTPKRYILLYWITIAYIVGIPNFVHFDQTGRALNPINVTSIGLVAETIVLGYLVFLILVVDRQPVAVRKLRVDLGLWIALLVELSLATAFEPSPASTTAVLLSLFRLSQWVLAFVLIIALHSRTPARHAMDLVVGLIGRSSWISVAIVWVVLPIFPGQAYGESQEDGLNAVRRLGGELIVPAQVALFAGIAFFYALLFFSRGPRRWAACLIALLTICLTGARTQEGGFILALLLYAIASAGRRATRPAVVGGTALVLLVGLLFSNSLMGYISRGQNSSTLSSLDGKTDVWGTSLNAIGVEPVLGYGYSVGARNAIRDHWRLTHWIPPHAHNEFIQMTLDGGVIALLLIVCILYRVFATSIRELDRGPHQLFLFIVLVQFSLDMLTGVELGYQYHGTACILILCCVGVLNGAAERVKDLVP